MPPRLLSPVLAALVVLPALTAPASATEAHRDSARVVLQRQLVAAFRHATARHVDWRFDVAGLGSFRHGAARRTPPASNNKLLVAETALQRLGPGYRYQTPVLAEGRLADGVLHGRLVVVGSGDPTLGDAALVSAARQLRAAGIRTVTGSLLVDDRRYAHRTTAPGWKPGFTPIEVGPIDAFAVDENAWNRSARYLAHTGLGNGRRFARILRHHRVRLRGHVRRGVPGADARTVATITSPPLSAIVGHMLTFSDNFYAEMLLDQIGTRPGNPGQRTTGVARIRAEARRLHVALGRIEDGSGLSYADRESPDALVRWLRASERSTTGAPLRAGLAVACRTGTLEHRLCGHATAGRVFAKTGTLDGITALSGFTTTRSGRAVTFAVLVSGARDLLTAERRVDAAVVAVARFDG